MTKEELVKSAEIPLIQPKEVDISGCRYRLGKYPAVAGREILSKIPMGLAADGKDYEVSEEAMFLVFRYIERVVDGGGGIRLVTRALIDSHVPDAGTLITDHVIDQPAEIDINIVMPHEFYGVDKAIEELDNLKKDNALLAVRVNKRIFTRMIITDVSQTANAETYSRQAFGIHFKEIMGGNRSNFSPTEAYDKSKQQKKGAKK